MTSTRMMRSIFLICLMGASMLCASFGEPSKNMNMQSIQNEEIKRPNKPNAPPEEIKTGEAIHPDEAKIEPTRPKPKTRPKIRPETRPEIRPETRPETKPEPSEAINTNSDPNWNIVVPMGTALSLALSALVYSLLRLKSLSEQIKEEKDKSRLTRDDLDKQIAETEAIRLELEAVIERSKSNQSDQSTTIQELNQTVNRLRMNIKASASHVPLPYAEWAEKLRAKTLPALNALEADIGMPSLETKSLTDSEGKWRQTVAGIIKSYTFSEMGRRDAVQRIEGFIASEKKVNSKSDILLLANPQAQNTVFWILGDVHGDLNALATAVEFIKSTIRKSKSSGDNKSHALALLGDMLDRSDDAIPALTYWMDTCQKCTDVFQQFYYIRGNHDVGLFWSDEAKQFASTVHPAEIVSQFNSDLELYKELGMKLIEFYRSCPASICIPYGAENNCVLLTHGGIPHDDVLKQWYEDKEEGFPPSKNFVAYDDWIADHVWGRITKSLNKQPNRGRSGHDLGLCNVKLFKHLLKARSDLNLTAVIGGHQHESTGYRIERTPFCQLITLNTMSSNITHPDRRPTIMRWIPDDSDLLLLLLPDIHS